MLAKIDRPTSTAATIVAKLSSASTMSAASLETSVPVIPMATPMSAAFSAGASLTPSPVIATVMPCALQGIDDPELVLRIDPGVDRHLPHRPVEFRVRHRLELGPGHRPAVGGDAELGRNDRRRLRVIAGDHDRPDPGALRARDRFSGLVPRRVDHADQPEEDQIALHLGVDCLGLGIPRERAKGDPEGTQRLAGKRLVALPDRGAALLGQRRRLLTHQLVRAAR